MIFEKLLQRYFDEVKSEFRLPADVEQYVQLDDMDLWAALRKSKNTWAQRIVQRIDLGSGWKSKRTRRLLDRTLLLGTEPHGLIDPSSLRPAERLRVRGGRKHRLRTVDPNIEGGA